MANVICYLEPDRLNKTRIVLEAFRAGCDGVLVNQTSPVVDAQDHVVMGMWSGAQKLIPTFHKLGLNYWHIDSGWIMGSMFDPTSDRYYRVTRNGMAPRFIEDCSFDRAEKLGIKIEPWRKSGSYVLVTLSSDMMGKPWGVNQDKWLRYVLDEVSLVTDREIRVRSKPKSKNKIMRPFLEDLEGAWCLVTYTSATAVQAALRGIPVFCEPSCGAAMVGCRDYLRVEDPLYPENRREWISSLVWQQFLKSEMQSGLAWSRLKR